MARFPSVPGGGPKGMNSPVYWTRMHLQNERYKATAQNAVDKFNERWNRLQDIQDVLTNSILAELIGKEVAKKKGLKLQKLFDEVNFWKADITEHIDIAKNSDLSKYATRVKNLFLFSINLSIELELFSDMESVEYVASEKMIYLNDEPHSFLG